MPEGQRQIHFPNLPHPLHRHRAEVHFFPLRRRRLQRFPELLLAGPRCRLAAQQPADVVPPSELRADFPKHRAQSRFRGRIPDRGDPSGRSAMSGKRANETQRHGEADFHQSESSRSAHLRRKTGFSGLRRRLGRAGRSCAMKARHRGGFGEVGERECSGDRAQSGGARLRGLRTQ